MRKTAQPIEHTDRSIPEWMEYPVLGWLVGVFVLVLCLAGAWVFVLFVGLSGATWLLWLVLGLVLFVAAMR